VKDIMRVIPSPEQLETILEDHGITVSSEQARLFVEHVRLMLEWNVRSNLTRITDFAGILTSHLLDSLLPACRLPLTGKTLDVGTGAGFPGVPLKILYPETEMVLLEANHKKVSFLKVLLSRLQLPGSRAVNGRWEEPGGWFAEEEEGFTLVVMRAVRLETGHLDRLAPRVLKPGGVFAWWAGPSADTTRENRKIHSSLAPLETLSYELPGMSAPRRIHLWRKKG
jgi:16S rRNA (guanine527-N7)-methyltransferase